MFQADAYDPDAAENVAAVSQDADFVGSGVSSFFTPHSQDVDTVTRHMLLETAKNQSEDTSFDAFAMACVDSTVIPKCFSKARLHRIILQVRMNMLEQQHDVEYCVFGTCNMVDMPLEPYTRGSPEQLHNKASLMKSD